MSETDNRDLSTLKLPELRKLAAEKGLKGVSALRKGELITAIQTGSVPAKAREAAAAAAAAAEDERPAERSAERAPEQPSGQENRPSTSEDNDERYVESRSQARRARRNRARQNEDGEGRRDQDQDRGQDSEQQQQNQNQDQGSDNRDRDRDRDRTSNNRNHQQNRQGDDDEQGGGGRRGRRNRRNRRNRGGDGQGDNQNQGQNQNHHQNQNQGQQQHADQNDQLQDVAGILDVVDANAAFLRTTGYKAGQADLFVNNNLVKRYDLRSGDAITGQVKMNGGAQTHGNGRNRKKYNALTRVDTINGMNPEESRRRPEFHKLTPLYPNQRLRLETEPNILTTRVIDLVMPIGKGQRALIVSPPKAGKTTIMQNIANAISRNNPECHLMVVLVDERPEEVTDMQRSVNGEVIASTFDRPPSEHTAVAELAIERAKRLVEMGKDVVVLLDSITRLGRAYNNSSPASGRILSGGVDSNALYPPKRFLGAARNIENGGSLTIIATAMVETGSAGDTVIFEEFKGTGNAELKLDRKISERRVFPAVDVNPSGTRKDELLIVPEEARIMHKLRRILAALDSQQAIDLLIKQLKKTKTNGEFLMQVASSAPMAADEDTEEYS
ncbi:transcription termination factor Rho [Corynebacterium doosanense]|uniref:Transcription termination factor Rho n=1 Tax=Corynebacterium doosanense CAU 212 = DSM 45436 TaxID=558173 RepID=A0A097IFF6_9CORY|nr:transcription termination factor Rho [Corynebacterium doosanense]AIT60845.1 transcription termination factor Rho [Corynebacterium doosanense CAU 212 = DSM 45436]